MQKVAKTINLPENILDRDVYSSLPSLQKEEYTHNLLKAILMLNPIGMTISDIKRNTYFSNSIIWHHLELLASKGELFKVERGCSDVYHFNNVLDRLKEFDIIDDKSPYHFGFNFDLIENPFGKFLRIQRIRESRVATTSIRAGVIVPYYLIDELFDVIKKIKDPFKDNSLNEK